MDYMDESSFADAVRDGNFKSVRAHIERNVDVNSPDSYGLTPLMWAIATNQPDMADLLLAAGARNCCKDMSGLTPKEQALSYGYDGIAKKIDEAEAAHAAIAENAAPKTPGPAPKISTLSKYHPPKE